MKDLFIELFEILEESELAGQISFKKGEKGDLSLKVFIQKRNDNNFYHEFKSIKRSDDVLIRLNKFVEGK